MATGTEKRKEKNDLHKEILTVMLHALMGIVRSGELTVGENLYAVKMLDDVRHELHIDHEF